LIQPTDREISSANRLPPRCRGEQTDESLAHNGDIMNTAAMVTYATTKSIRPEQNSNAVLKWTTYETSLGIVTFASMPRWRFKVTNRVLTHKGYRCAPRLIQTDPLPAAAL